MKRAGGEQGERRKPEVEEGEAEEGGEMGGGHQSPESAEGLVVVEVSWADGGNHGCFGVTTKTLL